MHCSIPCVNPPRIHEHHERPGRGTEFFLPFSLLARAGGGRAAPGAEGSGSASPLGLRPNMTSRPEFRGAARPRESWGPLSSQQPGHQCHSWMTDRSVVAPETLHLRSKGRRKHWTPTLTHDTIIASNMEENYSLSHNFVMLSYLSSQHQKVWERKHARFVEVSN